MNKRAALAEKLFREDGYNCAQSVFCAFEDLTGISQADGIRLSASFGGGMGRLREVCGAFSGAIMVLGALAAPDNPADRDAKAAHYARVQELAARFKAQRGTLICRDLLGEQAGEGHVPAERTAEYMAKRPCPGLVAMMAEILDVYLKEQGLVEK